MPRGEAAAVGTEHCAKNGYWYVKVAKDDDTTLWRLKHHLVAEKTLGRPLRDEQVRFKDGNKENFAPENIEVIPLGKSSLRRRIAQLTARRDEIDGMIQYYQKQLESS